MMPARNAIGTQPDDLAAGKKGASVVDSEWPNDLLPDVLLVFLAATLTVKIAHQLYIGTWKVVTLPADMSLLDGE